MSIASVESTEVTKGGDQSGADSFVAQSVCCLPWFQQVKDRGGFGIITLAVVLAGYGYLTCHRRKGSSRPLWRTA